MIKNFIYLDEEKMYSLSSQLFEGVTEYVLNENLSESQKDESQKGPVGSGRILGDILRQVDKKTEKRFLNDFSYSLFEKKLLDDGKVIEAKDNFLLKDLLDKAESTSFIKVIGKATFYDVKLIKDTLKNFNSLGLALSYIQVKEQLNQDPKNKSQQEKVKNNNKFIETYAAQNGLNQDQKFLDSIELILDYGFQDQLEIQIQLSDSKISANLKRECLRESEELIIKNIQEKQSVIL